MEKNRFHESKKEIQAYRVSSIATRPFHCEVIKATSINKDLSNPTPPPKGLVQTEADPEELLCCVINRPTLKIAPRDIQRVRISPSQD